jgi:hypothetical protein
MAPTKRTIGKRSTKPFSKGSSSIRAQLLRLPPSELLGREAQNPLARAPPPYELNYFKMGESHLHGGPCCGDDSDSNDDDGAKDDEAIE